MSPKNANHAPLAPVPQQQRSRESEKRLLDAAEELLADRIWEDVSIAEIALRAGMSVGGVYARFAAKENLLRALHARYERDRTERLSAFFEDDHWREAPLEARIRGLVDALTDLLERRRGVLRSFILEFWSARLDDQHALNERLGGLYDRAAEFLLERRHDMGRPDADTAVRLAINFMLAAAREHFLLKPAPQPGAVVQDREAFNREAARMMCAYLEVTERGDTQ